MSRQFTRDPWMEHAKEIIFAEDAVNVSLEAKNKDLIKFGRNELVGTSTTEYTIQHQPAGILHETYVSSNLINSIISTDAGDTEIVTIEGHTISGGVFTFVTQNATLTGQTVVALGTALARVSRVYNTGATELVGVISVTETDTYTAGVPDTDTLVHLQMGAGEQNSEKASTTISDTDYWVITSFYGDVLQKTAASAEIHLESRLVGGVFRDTMMRSASNNHGAIIELKPYIIIYPNSDVRLTAVASASNTDVSGGIIGSLLTA